MYGFRKSAATALWVVAALLTAGCPGHPTARLLSRADDALAAGRHRDACRLYRAALGRTDLEGRRAFAARRALIRCAARLGHLGALMAEARATLARHPDDPVAHYLLALAETVRAAGRTDVALGHLRAARRAAPAEAEYPHREGRLLLTVGRPWAALAPLTVAVKLRPRWAAPRVALARGLVSLGRYAAARATLASLPDCGPTVAEVERADAVIADIARHADPLPPAAKPLFDKAMELLRQEFSAAAADVLKGAMKKHPLVAVFPLLAGLAQIRLSNYGAAITLLRRAARSNRRDHAPHLHLAEIQATLGHHRLALPHYRRALALNPVSRRAHLGLGAALLKLHQGDQALPLLRRAAALSGSSSQALRSLARALVVAGRLVEATGVLRSAVRAEKEGVEARVALARLLLRRYRTARGDDRAEQLHAEARKLLDDVVKRAPENPEARELRRSLTGKSDAIRPRPR